MLIYLKGLFCYVPYYVPLKNSSFETFNPLTLETIGSKILPKILLVFKIGQVRNFVFAISVTVGNVPNESFFNKIVEKNAVIFIVLYFFTVK